MKRGLRDPRRTPILHARTTVTTALTIGLYNSAYELHGVQIGVLNQAKNNRAPFKILPVLNVHR